MGLDETWRITISCEDSHISYFEIFKTYVTFMVRPNIIVKCKYVTFMYCTIYSQKGTHWRQFKSANSDSKAPPMLQLFSILWEIFYFDHKKW